MLGEGLKKRRNCAEYSLEEGDDSLKKTLQKVKQCLQEGNDGVEKSFKWIHISIIAVIIFVQKIRDVPVSELLYGANDGVRRGA